MLWTRPNFDFQGEWNAAYNNNSSVINSLAVKEIAVFKYSNFASLLQLTVTYFETTRSNTARLRYALAHTWPRSAVFFDRYLVLTDGGVCHLPTRRDPIRPVFWGGFWFAPVSVSGHEIWATCGSAQNLAHSLNSGTHLAHSTRQCCNMATSRPD